MGEMNKAELARLEQEWSDPEKKSEPLTGAELDWRLQISAAYRDDDPDAMLQQSQKLAQYNIIRLANEGENDSIKLAASKLILEQAGRGAIQKVEQTVYNDQMTTPELVALLRSKLSRIQKVDPSFDLNQLLPADIVEAEVVSPNPLEEDEPLPEPEFADEVFGVEE